MFINFCIARPKYCFILCTPAVRQLWLNEYCYVYVKLSFTSGSSGHRVTGSSFWPGVRPEFFLFSKKMPRMQNVHLKCWNDKSHCQVSVIGLKSLDVSPYNELLLLPMIIKNSLAWEYFFTRKSTCGVHYRTGSPGQLGIRVAGFSSHWVAGSHDTIRYDAILTCARKPTWVSLIYRTEPTTKKCKNRKD